MLRRFRPSNRPGYWINGAIRKLKWLSWDCLVLIKLPEIIVADMPKNMCLWASMGWNMIWRQWWADYVALFVGIISWRDKTLQKCRELLFSVVVRQGLNTNVILPDKILVCGNLKLETSRQTLLDELVIFNEAKVVCLHFSSLIARA